ncbi:DSCR6 protein, partial [Polypterus senegalus]|nr:DSCR6 protein [Polypterus senegalus]
MSPLLLVIRSVYSTHKRFIIAHLKIIVDLFLQYIFLKMDSTVSLLQSRAQRKRTSANLDETLRCPKKLCVPKSKSHQYLSAMGEKVLASFPIQATIHFYNDDSDSEEEETENMEEEQALGSTHTVMALDKRTELQVENFKEGDTLFWKQNSKSKEDGSVAHRKHSVRPSK